MKLITGSFKAKYMIKYLCLKSIIFQKLVKMEQNCPELDKIHPNVRKSLISRTKYCMKLLVLPRIRDFLLVFNVCVFTPICHGGGVTNRVKTHILKHPL